VLLSKFFHLLSSLYQTPELTIQEHITTRYKYKWRPVDLSSSSVPTVTTLLYNCTSEDNYTLRVDEGCVKSLHQAFINFLQTKGPPIKIRNQEETR
jgi:hypothetical protein